MAQPFDVKRLELRGEPTKIAEPVSDFSVSSNGVLAYRSGSVARSQLVWFDRSGKQTGTVGEPGALTRVELSPDGTRAAVTVSDVEEGLIRGQNLWIYNASSGARQQFTFEQRGSYGYVASWSPDGSRIAFSAAYTGERWDLMEKVSNGAGPNIGLLSDQSDKWPESWSSDGRYLAYGATHTSGKPQLWVLPLSGDRKPVPFQRSESSQDHPRFSPDGRWVAYTSNESGRNEIYVASFPLGGKWRVSSAGGTFARWRRDGKELFFLSPDDKLMSAAVTTQDQLFEIRAVRPLFGVRPRLGQYCYDVTPDGQRFLVNTLVDQAPVNPITIVVNWTAMLKKQ